MSDEATALTGECEGQAHKYPLPDDYVSAHDEAEIRRRAGWRSLRCPDCGRPGWKPPVSAATAWAEGVHSATGVWPGRFRVGHPLNFNPYESCTCAADLLDGGGRCPAHGRPEAKRA